MVSKHRRGAKNTFGRKKNEGKKEPNRKILIVCEGSKTEPDYFNALCKDLRISTTAKVEICGDSGSSPQCVLSYAKRKIEISQKKTSRHSYDCVYCVMDQDTHLTFKDTIQSIKEHNANKGNLPIEAIVSTPCFEFWILLHYQKTTRPFEYGDDVCSYIRKNTEWTDFSKKQSKQTYAKIKDNTDIAIQRAASIFDVDEPHANPSTHVHLLVEKLIEEHKK